ncbi:hypothetical protein Ancab_003344 [Ancistrocladus abbreviatus]
MGSNQSVQAEEEEDDDEEEDDNNGGRGSRAPEVKKKILEQEPEMLPCYASASPLSPQLSSLGTPRLGTSIKVWDPYNVLAPPPPLPPPPPLLPQFSRSFSSDTLVVDDDRTVTEVYLINHGESEMNLRPELINGRCPDATLTANGKRQEINFSAQQIQSLDALGEMSMGHWEGCLRSDICTPEVVGLIERLQPDFSAPSGESLRQVEFRMIQFLNGTLLGLPEKLRTELASPQQNEGQGFSQQNSHSFTNLVPDRDGPASSQLSQWDSLHRHRPFSRKKSGKSRLQVVTSTGDHDPEDEVPPQGLNPQTTTSVRSSSYVSSCIGVFTHSVPIKCLLTGVLGCSPVMSHKICIEDSSMTVLQYTWKMGWQVKRLNDTGHLRLL